MNGIPDIVKGLTEAPAWQQADANGRRGMVRELAVAAMADGVPDEEMNPFLAELYDKAGAKGAVGWTKDAVVEAAKSVPAGLMAAGAALTDAAGLTDTGSGDRLRQGKEDFTESVGQRLKSLAPGDNQEVRDRAFADFKADLESGAAPPEVDFYLQHRLGPPQREKKLAGGFSTLEENPAERAAWETGRQWLGDWSEVLLRVSEQAQNADAGEESFDFARKRGQGMFDPAIPELVADYMATRDPAVWSAIQNVGSESQTGYNIRKTQEQGLREWGLQPEQSLADDLAARAMAMQSSPIDMAMTAFPLLKGAQALKAARGGRMAQALRTTAESAAGEFVSEAATEALSDSGRAGTGQILEAGAMGAVGGGALTGGSAAAGAVMSLPGKRAEGTQSSPSVEVKPQGAPVEAPGMGAAQTEEAVSAPAPVVPSDVTRLPALLDPAAGPGREGGLLEALVVEDEEIAVANDAKLSQLEATFEPNRDQPYEISQQDLAVDQGSTESPVPPGGEIQGGGAGISAGGAQTLEQAFRAAVSRGAVPPVQEAPVMLEPTPELLDFAARGALRDAGAAVSPDTGGVPAPAEAQRSVASGIEVGRVGAPPVPDSLETVTEQARLAADRNSTRRAVLITPGTPRPEKTPGLKGVKTPHGLLLYNPKKVPLKEAMAAARAEVFDARILGMSEMTKPEGQMPKDGAVAVTASTPAAPNVQAELVSDPAGIPAAVAAAEAAAPGARVEVKPAAQVLTERVGARQTTPEWEQKIEELKAEGRRIANQTFENPADKADAIAANREAIGQARADAHQAAIRLRRETKAEAKSPENQVDFVQVGRFVKVPRVVPVYRKGQVSGGKEISEGGRITKVAGQQVEVRLTSGGYWTGTVDRVSDDPGHLANASLRPSAQAAAPGAVVEVKPAAQVLAERGEGAPAELDFEEYMKGFFASYLKRERVRVEKLNRDFGWTEKIASDAEISKDAAAKAARFVEVMAKWKATGREHLSDSPFERNRPEQVAAARAVGFDVAAMAGAIDAFTQQMAMAQANGESIPQGTLRAFQMQEAKPAAQRVLNPDLPWQMTPQQFAAEFEFVRQKGKRRLFLSSGRLMEYSAVPQQKNGQLTAAADKVKAEMHAGRIRNALLSSSRPALSAEAVDSYGIELPKGYVKSGDAYVYVAPALRPSVSPSSPSSPAPTTKHGQSAVRILGSKAPEIVRDLRVVANVGELNPADYTPAQWAGIQESGTEGFYHPASGQSVVILENIQPRAGESPVRAVARVILHERLGHAGLGLLRRSDAQFARRWADLVARIPAEELMAIASEAGYAGIASDEQALAEEWLARHAERVKLEPPGSPLRQLWDALVAAVRRLMSAFSPGGMTAEQLAASLLQRSRKALARRGAETQSEGETRFSRVSPERDADYLAAVERGDMAAAQGMVDEAARAAGYNVGPVWHGTPDGRFLKTEPVFKSEKARMGWGREAGVHWFADSKRTANTYADDRRAFDYQNAEPMVIPAYVKLVNPLTVDGRGEQWRAAQTRGRTTNAIQEAIDGGHDGVVINNVQDDYQTGAKGRTTPTNTYAVFSSSAIKSADPVTRDADGAVIPLSKRFDAASDDIRFSRVKSPLEVRDLPEWAKKRLGLNVPAPYRVQGQAVRRILKGDALPKGWGDVLAKAGHEVDGILSHMGTLAGDMQRAMKAHAKASTQPLERVERAVQIALTGDRLRILPAGAVRESAVAVRAFLDGLSAQVAAITGGDLGDAILDNRGHWMRRSYLAFDNDADWNYDTLKAAADKGKTLHGRDARAILARAEKFLKAENPTATPAALAALMRDLTDRNALADVMAGTGPRVTKEVTSLMRRRTIPKALRDLMGEVRDPFANAVGSVKFQAQFIARHDQQQTLARIGLASGLISHRKEGEYHVQLGDGTQRWSGFYAKTASGKTVPLYTTPELMQAMQSSPAMGAQDVGHAFLRGIQALNGIAKANKVALNPDSMAPQYFGNVVSLIMGGDLLWLDGWKNMAEAVRIYRSGRAQDVAALKPVEKALLDSRRQMLARMTAAGVVNSASLDDLRATLDTAMLKFSEAATAWDRTAGFAHGALLGQAFGRTFGAGGRLIGAAAGAAGGAVVGEQAIQRAFHKIAQWAVGHPDRVGKMTSFLTNLEHELAAGTPDAAAVAAGKTLDTLPAYEKVPQFLRSMSKYSMIGTFFAFKYETLRNAYHNVRLGVQELRSGNAPLVRRGVRRLAGTAAVAALLRWGIPALGGLVGKGLGDDEDRVYRKWLGAPWERDALLTFTHFDGEKASFFNSGYLIPQGMIVEWARSAKEDGFDGFMGKVWQDFAEGSVVLDPLIDALRNAKKDMPERPVSYKKGYEGFLERLDYVVQRVLEPGAADKLMRVRRAVMDEPTAGRSFSTQEELLRLAGFRSYTYDHQPRIASTLYKLNDEKQKITAEARARWKSNRPGERATAVPDANARMEALDAEAAEFTRAMKLLKLPSETRTPGGDRLRFKPGVRLWDSAAGPVVR